MLRRLQPQSIEALHAHPCPLLRAGNPNHQGLHRADDDVCEGRKALSGSGPP